MTSTKCKVPKCRRRAIHEGFCSACYHSDIPESYDEYHRLKEKGVSEHDALIASGLQHPTPQKEPS